MDLSRFPGYYKAYFWHDKHGLFGYPADSYPNFHWIQSLERRFLHYRQHSDSVPLFLIKEMIQWGGSQNGVLEKFDNALGSYCLHTNLETVLQGIHDPRRAIQAALAVPGLGLTYASKLLRFLDPKRYGALDGRIRKALGRLNPAPLPNIYDSSPPSMASGYCKFVEYIDGLASGLRAGGIQLPHEGEVQREWRAADIEMALFQWASSQAEPRTV